MSHHGIGLSFSFGPGGRPEVTLLGDLLAQCGSCGYESGLRKYLAVPFHTLTLRAVAERLRALPEQMLGVCPQCDDALDSDSVRACAVHYGFPSGAGVIRGFSDGDEVSWLLCPHDVFDVQEVPRWNPAADASRVEARELSEELLCRVFGRPLCAKEEARRFVRAGRVGALRCGPDLTLVRGIAADAAEAAAVSAENASIEGEWVAVALSGASGLLDGFFGAPAGWLRGVDAGPDILWGCASLGGLEEAIAGVVKGFPIEVGLEREVDTLAMILPGDDSEAPRPLLGLREIAYEAARSMSSPGDIARLEIDRILHGLTGLWVA